ncbi:MAG TPA: hypothetical protein PKM73_12775 [Verrucomicrobiota bacterium]|nr:hypothetical protein [Verrucomicrobiota bacterium]HNU51601.1 hypothetical protein [Verrucomicrobiota bacterium]
MSLRFWLILVCLGAGLTAPSAKAAVNFCGNQVVASDRLGPEAVWRPVLFALAEPDAACHQALVGNGYYLSLYADPGGAAP